MIHFRFSYLVKVNNFKQDPSMKGKEFEKWILWSILKGSYFDEAFFVGTNTTNTIGKINFEV